MNGFVKLGGIQTETATPNTKTLENALANLKRGITRLEQLPEYMKVKGSNIPIALVGGGPSLSKNLDELRKFKTIFACGSVHDYLIENDIIPTYTGVCDPDPICADYITRPHTETKYLIAYGCDKAVYDRLDGKQIIGWHCHSDELAAELQKHDPLYHGIGGGCTIGLRSINIALMFGYDNQHFFGYDSCIDEDKKTHAYDMVNPEYEMQTMHTVYEIKAGPSHLGEPTSGVYKCYGYHLAQADQYKSFYERYYQYLRPTFHGGGLLNEITEIVDGYMIEKEIEKVVI